MASLHIKLSDCPTGETRLIEIGGKAILLCRTKTNIQAVDIVCPHQIMSLEGARIRGESLICPHHGARFSLGDGKSMSPLTANPLRLITTRVEGDVVVVEA